MVMGISVVSKTNGWMDHDAGSRNLLIDDNHSTYNTMIQHYTLVLKILLGAPYSKAQYTVLGEQKLAHENG